MSKAEHSIVLVGWDFDLRIKLTPGREADAAPDRLGSFLREIVRRKPHLEIFVLKWDMAIFYTLTRRMLPLFALDLLAGGRTHLRLDSAHPWTAAHHQKIVVIDDALAFCGGIDMTSDRWDTRGHLPGDRRRVRPDGSTYPPWHDAAVAVDGAAASALGELARERWRLATGETLPVTFRSEDLWPDCLEPQMHEVDVAIARTMPAYAGRPEIREIENLYVAAIRSARRIVYLESQYFASARICAEIARRLAEPGGPEVIVVNPMTAEGWLEQETMGAARAAWLAQVHDADSEGRFRIYCPVNDAGEAIYVHAKILLIDDNLLRVGSSNINNRSMGFDSECDLAVEAKTGTERRAIVHLRHSLLAEHLGRTIAEVDEAVAAHESFARAVDALLRSEGRGLRPLPFQSNNSVEEAIARLHLADPESPEDPESRLQHAAKRVFLSVRPRSGVSFLLGVLGGFALSRLAHLQALKKRRRHGGRLPARGGPPR